MTISITRDEIQRVVNLLGEVPSKYVYEVIKFLELKLAESSNEAKKEDSQSE